MGSPVMETVIYNAVDLSLTKDTYDIFKSVINQAESFLTDLASFVDTCLLLDQNSSSEAPLFIGKRLCLALNLMQKGPWMVNSDFPMKYKNLISEFSKFTSEDEKPLPLKLEYGPDEADDDEDETINFSKTTNDNNFNKEIKFEGTWEDDQLYEDDYDANPEDDDEEEEEEDGDYNPYDDRRNRDKPSTSVKPRMKRKSSGDKNKNMGNRNQVCPRCKINVGLRLKADGEDHLNTCQLPIIDLEYTMTDSKKYKCKCSKEFNNRSRYYIHYVTIHLDDHLKTIICDVCQTRFYNDTMLRRHKAVYHISKCKLCQEEFKSRQEYLNHMNTHHKEAFKCPHPDCYYTTGVRSTLSSHMKSVHVDHKCNKCGKPFMSSAGLYKHIKRVHENLRYICAQCGKSFNAKTELNYHVYDVHDKLSRKCEKCGNKIICERKHARQCGRKYICDVCGKNYNEAASLRIHFVTVHEGLRITCPRCGKVFTKSGFKQHRRKCCKDLVNTSGEPLQQPLT